MPYVRGPHRDSVDQHLPEPHEVTYWSPGMLAYAITRIVLMWVGDNVRFSRINAAVGALETLKLELYRRKVAPYEDRKIDENGDVYA